MPSSKTVHQTKSLEYSLEFGMFPALVVRDTNGSRLNTRPVSSPEFALVILEACCPQATEKELSKAARLINNAFAVAKA